jgi:hypothetical protein
MLYGITDIRYISSGKPNNTQSEVAAVSVATTNDIFQSLRVIENNQVWTDSDNIAFVLCEELLGVLWEKAS